MSKCLSKEQMAEREAEAERLEAEMAKVCGALNAGMGRLMGLIARVLDTNAWCGWGIRSPEHWVAWKCGVSSAHARKLVHMARRLPELPETAKSFQAGELSEDQVSVVCRHIPAWADAEVAELAHYASVSQLSATLRRYSFDDDAPGEDETEERPPDKPEPRSASFSGTEEGGWRLSATLPPDEGGLVERALQACRRFLADDGEVNDPSWADALVLMAERALAERASARAHRDRHMLLVHLRADDHGPNAYVHLGQALPDSIRRLLGCDGRIRPVVEVAGVPYSVGRAQRLVPERTRVAVEDRDGSCRVPGCGRTRWLQVHHIVHVRHEAPCNRVRCETGPPGCRSSPVKLRAA